MPYLRRTSPGAKQSGWVERPRPGLVNPNVLRMSRIDPEKWGRFRLWTGLDPAGNDASTTSGSCRAEIYGS